MRKAIVLSVLIAVPILAIAFNGKAKVGGLWYNIVTKAEKAEVTKPDVGNYSGVIRIPSTIVYEGVTCEVTAIGDGAFAWGSITSVTIPNTVTKIGPVAFRWCENLKSITLPNSVTEIGTTAFGGCYSLTSVKLSENITTIESGLFEGCNQLKTIVIPEGVTKIESGAFRGCRELTSVTLNDGLTSISDDAFLECGLQSISIPNSVTEIGSGAFNECKSLKSVTVGSGIENLNSTAFAECGDLKNFYFNGDRLPEVHSFSAESMFRNSDVEYATLHVDESLIDICKLTPPWSGFGKIVVNPNAIAAPLSAISQSDTIYEIKDCHGQIPRSFIPKINQWIEENVKYPEEAKAQNISGRVWVDFVVEPDGSISNVKAWQDSKPELVSEAERVVKSMHKWKAGKVDGKFARVKECIYVDFGLPK